MNTAEYKEIANGVKLLCVNSEKFKTNCVSIDFYLPVGDLLAEQTVLSSLMGHTSKKYDTFKKFNAKTESLYGADFSSTIACVGEKVRIRFSMELPDDKFSLDGESVFENAVDFLIDIIKNPDCENGEFTKASVEREIRFALQNIEAEKNDKRAYALSRLRQLMCENEPFGIDREKLENDIKNLDGKKLYNAYVNMLETAHIAITACGNIDGEFLKNKITDFAKSIENRHIAELKTVFITKAGDVRYFNENMDVGQAKMVIGLRSGMENSNDTYYAFRIMTDVFGGGPYSRLFINVREKKSLCYYCGARLVREKGIIFIQCGVEKEKYEEALGEILSQLDVMKKGEFTDEDINSSIKAMADAYKGVGDSPASICAFYASQVFDEKALSGKEIAGHLSAVTREQVIECAKKVTLDSIYLLAKED